MKTKFFTFLSTVLLLGSVNAFAQDMGTGVDWSENPPSEPLLIDEDFTGFSFFHSDETADQGNSSHALGDDGLTIIWGYKELKMNQPIVNGGGGTVEYDFYQCAFAPEWMSAYGYRDFSATGSGTNSPNVSDGFVEISRFDTVYSAIPQARGMFTVDLRGIEYVEMIQWSHSSTGGKRRGVLCEFSLDDAATWDTLRFQPGEQWTLGFTKDVFTGEKTMNTYRCEPSGYGMSWADGIYSENIMLRFSSTGIGTIQTARLHDLKVYGTYTPNAVGDITLDAIKIYSANKQIFLSETANVDVYNLSGVLVSSGLNTNQISMDSFSNGIYFVKATVGNTVQTTKVLLK